MLDSDASGSYAQSGDWPLWVCFSKHEFVSARDKLGRIRPVGVQLSALTASDTGCRVFIVADACGGMSERTEQAAIQRIAKAGGASVSVMMLAGEFAGDFRTAEAQSAIQVLYDMASA